MKVQVGVSNRHIHLKKEDLKILFGEDFELVKVRDLNQPNQFVTGSKVTIETEKGKIENVRVIGDIREYTQVEISKTDAYTLGLNPPISESGDIENSEEIKVIGLNGTINIKGCIIADRHIHITSKQKEMFGYKNTDTVSVLIDGQKGGRIDNVHLKVSDPAYFELHLDTDDANAFLLKNNDLVEIIDYK